MFNSVKKYVLVLVLVLLPSWVWAADKVGYQLQPGDIIEISVWKEPDLQRELLVTPDGDISFPLVGSLKAKGETIRSLRSSVIGKLSVYIPDPSVTVTLRQTAGNMYYVIGKVNRPGQYPMVGPVSVLQALSVAGGMTAFASENKIKVIRGGHSNKAIAFEYGEIARGENLEQNILLKSGDVVLVP